MNKFNKYLEMATSNKKETSSNLDEMLTEQLHNLSKEELIDMIFNYGFDKGFDEDTLDNIDDIDSDELIDIIISDLKTKGKEKLYREAIKSQADEIRNVKDLKNMAKVLAQKHIAIHGYYTFTEKGKDGKNKKIFVEK